MSRERRETNRANVLGEEERADGQGPAAVPRGRRATVSAGLELALFRAGLQTAARNQTRTTHSRTVHGHTRTHKPHRASELETNKQRELAKHTRQEQSVYSAHT